jgi:predicted CXXCH cytochrome family protein
MRRLSSLTQPLALWLKGIVATWLGLVLMVAVSSCRTVSRTVVVLPNISGLPNAKYIGTKACEECHPELFPDFQTADHARLITDGPNALQAGCESCHGPSSLHAQSGGEVMPPYSFSSGRPLTALNARLAVPPARATEAVCYECHADIRGRFNLPSHHPVPEGKMSCSECHPPHKGSAQRTGGTGLLSQKDGACNTTQPSAVHVFEHEAVREGCTTCHDAHGSINAKMLTVRDSNLCLKCHFQRASGGRLLIGGSDHTVRVQQGTCWTAGCHEAVHGSRVSSSLRF